MSKRTLCGWALGATLVLALAATGGAQTKPTRFPVPAPRDEAALGTGVQRTMTLLATSTPQHHNKVRILVYGQSISEQDWWRQVAEDLRQRFPNADLDIQNRAIGGFASQLLIWPAEHDLYPFYPDLVIFHVYGAHNTYEDIIRSIRSRTAAEVLMQRDHAAGWPTEPQDEKQDKGRWWDHFMNEHFLPETARKYGCGLADVRGGWVDYLKANDLQPKDLLRDGVHLNDHGCYLMAELVKRHLVYRPELGNESWRDLVRTIEVGKDVQWRDGKLTVPFDGNRVDVLAAENDGKSPSVSILVDGKKPSEFDAAYCITRPQPSPWQGPVALTRVDHVQAPVVEEWTLKVTSVSDDGKTWTFTVSGSVTGDDGAGTNTQPFTSTSGRVKIPPQAWFTNSITKQKVPVGFTIRWKVQPMFVDSYQAPATADPTKEYPTTLVQGIANGQHTLEISGQAPIRTIRVYRPP